MLHNLFLQQNFHRYRYLLIFKSLLYFFNSGILIILLPQHEIISKKSVLYRYIYLPLISFLYTLKLTIYNYIF